MQSVLGLVNTPKHLLTIFSVLFLVYFLKEKSNTVLAKGKLLRDSSRYGDIKCIRNDN